MLHLKYSEISKNTKADLTEPGCESRVAALLLASSFCSLIYLKHPSFPDGSGTSPAIVLILVFL